MNLINDAYEKGVWFICSTKTYWIKTIVSTINEVQKKLIKNIYTQRLTKQLEESRGVKIVTESNPLKLLYTYISGDEFKFFDTNGNFVGDHLKSSNN